MPCLLVGLGFTVFKRHSPGWPTASDPLLHLWSADYRWNHHIWAVKGRALSPACWVDVLPIGLQPYALRFWELGNEGAAGPHILRVPWFFSGSRSHSAGRGWSFAASLLRLTLPFLFPSEQPLKGHLRAAVLAFCGERKPCRVPPLAFEKGLAVGLPRAGLRQVPGESKCQGEDREHLSDQEHRAPRDSTPPEPLALAVVTH